MNRQYKPRAKQLNDILRAKRGGEHEPKQGKHVSRAKTKQSSRFLVEEA